MKIKNVVAFLTLAGVLFVLPYTSSAADFTCPENVAENNTDPTTSRITEIVKNIYRDLGCNTRFHDVPLKRSMQGFNNGKYDGEVLRMVKAEKAYQVPFVRSKQPLTVFRNAVWNNPQLNQERFPSVGYVLGVYWQEDFVEDKEKVKFRSSYALINAFCENHVKRALISENTIRLLEKEGKLKFTPREETIVNTADIYHYVHGDYSAFMNVFSTYVATHDPFKELRVTDKM